MIRSDDEAEMLIEIAGSSMCVTDGGQGEVVVLCHDYLWDAEMWRPQIDALSKHYRVIVPDLWGHGGSGPLPKGTRDLHDIALHHLDVLDRLDVSRFSIVGLGVGGMSGAEIALIAPERIRGLVLIGADLGTETETARRRH